MQNLERRNAVPFGSIKKTYNGIPLKVDYHCNIIPSGATKSIHRFEYVYFRISIDFMVSVQLKELTISVIGILHIVNSLSKFVYAPEPQHSRITAADCSNVQPL